MTEIQIIKATFLNGYISCVELAKFTRRDIQAFIDIGINPRSAQHDVLSLIEKENETYNKSVSGPVHGLPQLPNYMDLKGFLDQMAYKYSGCTVFVVNENLLGLGKGETNEDETGKLERHEGTKRESNGDSASRSGSENNTHSNRRSLRTQSRKNYARELRRKSEGSGHETSRFRKVQRALRVSAERKRKSLPAK
jgi:hypothetical protein